MLGSDTFKIGDGKFLNNVKFAWGWQYFNLDDYQAGTSTQAACSSASFEGSDVINLFYGVDFELGNFGWNAIQIH
jgi:hypothetical protein